MQLLNQDATYESVATPLSRSMFIDGDNQTKEYLSSGTRLIRFTRMGSAAPVCEWWLLFDRMILEDRRAIPGFANFLADTGSKVDWNGHFVPNGHIFLGCANPGSKVDLVQLNTPVYAFLGPTTPRRPDPCEPGLALNGGEFRVWIPGLGAQMVNHISIPPYFRVQPGESGAEAVAPREASPESENDTNGHGSESES